MARALSAGYILYLTSTFLLIVESSRGRDAPCGHIYKPDQGAVSIRSGTPKKRILQSIGGLDLRSCGKHHWPFQRYTQAQAIGSMQNRSKRVSFGYEMQFGQFPSLVRIEFRNINNEFSSCGGTLVASDMVLTAAHCFYLISNSRVSIFAGLVDIDKQSQNIHGAGFQAPKFGPEVQVAFLEKACQHDFYDYYSDVSTHDLAVIKLDRKLKWTQMVQPACLIPYNSPPAPNEFAYMTGSGAIDETMRQSSATRYVLARRSRCVRAARNEQTSTCYRSLERGNICPGDSGSGLFVIRNGLQYLAGIASTGLVTPGFDGWPSLCSTQTHNENGFLDLAKEWAALSKLLQECSV